MKYKLFLMLLLLATATSILSAQKFVYEKDEAALQQLANQLKQSDAARNDRISEYLKKHPKEQRTFRTDQNIYTIYDIKDGKPIFLSTHNDGSVRSTNADEVREGGKFGLNITGQGLRVAVWDGGGVSRSHVEFQDRLEISGSSEIVDHACHVLGTVMAGGVDPNARGYLFEAKGKAYSFEGNAFQEVIAEIQNENLLTSNHSYGPTAGWDGSNWRGDEDISTEEDYRFGFYTNNSRIADNVTYSAPYHSLFKSAGNHRGDSGDGSHPADGPYDIIAGWAGAKNIFTIGAVRKLSGDYTSPADIQMSSFSSWGPTDDGRIKPDFVMPGVGIYSSVCEDGDDQYGMLQGTSMATPGALGAAMLINEAYKQFNNTYLKSASLKALMIQTAMEAGANPGPDYSFGWGMIDVEAAVDHIIAIDGSNTFLLEETLLNQGTYEIELNPVAGQKITATIAWTDPAGTPVERSLDPADLMLINDLDMRIVDELGNEVQPWILDPAVPVKAASTGDNFRDNVEKIEFANPQPRRYFLRITHKGSLQNGRQDFSLVLRYTSEDPGIENLYWVGGDGNWSDPNHWALTSGGSPSNVTPGPTYKLIFDDNSFPGTEHTVVMDQSYAVAGIVGLNNKNITYDFGGNSLTSSGTALLASSNFTLTNGTLQLENANPNVSQILDLDQSKSSDLAINLTAANQAKWNINGGITRGSELSILGGNLFINESQIQVGEIAVAANAGLQISSSTIENFTAFSIAPGATWVDDTSSSFFINDDIESIFEAPGYAFQAPLQIDNGQIRVVASDAQFSEVRTNGAQLRLGTNLAIAELMIGPGSLFKVQEGSTIAVDNLDVEANAGARVTFEGTSEGPNGVLSMVPHARFCFDFLDIVDLDLAGSGAVSVGENSQVTNSAKWFVGPCEDLLFANFNVQFACFNGITFFEDLSEGNVAGQTWFVDGEEVASGGNAEYFFPLPGTYEVALEITDGLDNFTSFTQTIEVVESDIEANSIIQNPTQLASLKLGDSYQWYKNYEPIPGATGRVYLYEGEAAVYFVLTFVDGCNRISEVLDLLGTAVENLDKDPNPDIRIFPNPVNDMLYIQSKEIFKDPVEVSLSNALGQKVLQSQSSNSQLVSIDIAGLTPGIYILSLSVGDQVFTKKIVKSE